MKKLFAFLLLALGLFATARAFGYVRYVYVATNASPKQVNEFEAWSETQVKKFIVTSKGWTEQELELMELRSYDVQACSTGLKKIVTYYLGDDIVATAQFRLLLNGERVVDNIKLHNSSKKAIKTKSEIAATIGATIFVGLVVLIVGGIIHDRRTNG